MKTFKVKSDGKVYTVKANDAEHAIKLVKTAGNVTKKNLEDNVKDAATDDQIRYIHERGKDIATFADSLKTLQSGGKVRGYNSSKELADEIITFAKGIIDVCSRIK